MKKTRHLDRIKKEEGHQSLSSFTFYGRGKLGTVVLNL